MPKIKIKIKIKVTRNHIKNGEQESSDSCPIALACRSHPAFKGAEGIKIGDDTLECSQDIQIPLPKAFMKKLEKEGFDLVDVGLPYDGVFTTSRDIDVKLPKKARNFIDKFDANAKVKPFEFSVTI